MMEKEINNKEKLMQQIRNGTAISATNRLRLTLMLATPAMLAQLSSILMQYIDAAMVGSLGANASASIGLVSTSMWLYGGLCTAVGTGFSVQVAHHIGGSDMKGARTVLRQALVACTLFSILLGLSGVFISSMLPAWLGAPSEIHTDSSAYFLIFSATLPGVQLYFLSGSMLRCAGNMIVPAVISLVMCLLDILFNFLLIFPERLLSVCGFEITMPGAGMGVTGAAIGTSLSQTSCGIILLIWLVFKSRHLKLYGTHSRLKDFIPQHKCISRAAKISLPMIGERIMFCGAQIATTIIVAPLGAISLSAHAFAITAESLCYMPGFGIAEAATTLVGQSIGAKRRRLTVQFGNLTVLTGIVVMSIAGGLMYMFAYQMMSIMTSVEEIRLLGEHALRIEAWAEPLYAASIVAYGVFIGAGDTFIPSIMNLGSMWCVRIFLAVLLVPETGLLGVWIAMCIELCFRGIIFIWRLKTKSWLKNKI